MRPVLRTVAALLAFSAWMALLMIGLTPGGTAFLLLAVAVVVFPWRSVGEHRAAPDQSGAG